MTKENFKQAIFEAHQRLENLLQLASLATEQSIEEDYPTELLQQAITEISISLEELHQQNEELITTRNLVEAEHQRYHDLFNFAPDGYLVTDFTGIIQEANYAAANLLNLRQSYLIGKPMPVFVHQTERQKFRQIMLQLQQQGQIKREELQFFHNQASIDFPAELTAIAVEDSQGKTVSLRWLFRDIRSLAKVPNTPPPTPPRKRGGETKHSFGGVGFLFLIYARGLLAIATRQNRKFANKLPY